MFWSIIVGWTDKTSLMFVHLENEGQKYLPVGIFASMTNSVIFEAPE